MKQSDDLSKLAPALATAQPQIKTAIMGSTNPFFKSKYADLGAVWDAVREALEINGLAVTQFPDAIGEHPALTTMLIHSSGQWLQATYPLMVPAKEETAQGFGSAISYARRYGLAAVMGVIADEDDDGNAASKKPPPANAPKPAAAKSTPPDPDGQGAEWVRRQKLVIDECNSQERLEAWLDKYAGFSGTTGGWANPASGSSLYRLKANMAVAYEDLHAYYLKKLTEV